MRTMTMLALAATVTTTAVPAAAYYWTTSRSEDHLGDTLRNYGFVPINPPSNLMNVGSLYYVDSRVKDFRAICNAEKADLEGSVVSSPSWEMQESLERNGRFATGVKVDVGWLLNGGLDNNYVVKVHSSLTDVRLEEIPLGSNWLIFAKLMEKPHCNEVAMRYIHAGGYVCQGQKILHATAEFKLDRDAQSKLAASSKVAADNIKDIVKLAVESQSEQAVVEGRPIVRRNGVEVRRLDEPDLPRATRWALSAHSAADGIGPRRQFRAVQHCRADPACQTRPCGSGARRAPRRGTEVTGGRQRL